MHKADLAELVLRAVKARHEGQLDRLREISSVDAPSGDAESLASVADIIASWLNELGVGLLFHSGPDGAVIEAVCGPAGGIEPEILILCHYDTVWPHGTVSSRPLRVDGDIVHGPGVLDMRGGLVAAIEALGIVLENRLLTGPVRMVITPDEETGSQSSRELIELRSRRAGLVLVPEPALPDGGLKTARKGWLSYEVGVKGRTAHAGLDPDSGVSAVDELVDILAKIRRCEDSNSGTTVNCGVIEGGTAANVVAGSARALVDVRVPTNAQESRIRKVFDGLHPERSGAEISVELLHSRPPLVRSLEIAAAAGRVQEIGKLIGAEIPEGSAGGVSDANLAAAQGATVIDGLGPVGDGAHAQHEWVSLDSIAERTSLIALIMAVGRKETTGLRETRVKGQNGGDAGIGVGV